MPAGRTRASSPSQPDRRRVATPSPSAFRPPRLYAILDADLASSRGLRPADLLRIWLDAGIRLVQLRAKGLTFGPFLEAAVSMAEACRGAGATFIVNDRADVARLAGADGAHVGQDDLTPAEVKRIWPDIPVIGWSTHNDGQVRAGLAAPATYLAIGPVFGTTTKARPDADVGLDGVRRAAAMCRETVTPLVAIGGIGLESAAAVLEAGADAVAVISDLVSGPDAAVRAREWVRRFGS
jgi:thiamine-phosphate pyrophosphorylase